MKIKIILAALLWLTLQNLYAIELSLEDCKNMALQTDEDLRIASNNITASSLNRGIAKSSYFPRISGMASGFYMTPDAEMNEAMTFQMKGVYLAGFSLVQPIYTGGKIITANKLAKLGEDVAKQQMEAIRMDILAEAEKSYWMYIAVLSKVKMIESYITQLDSIYDYTKSAFELGLTTQINLTRVESRKSELKYRLQQSKSGADLCRLALCRIIGVDDTTEIIPTENIDKDLPPVRPYKGIESRPELHLAKLNINAKKYDVKMTLSDYLPSIGLQLGWNAFGNLKTKSMVELPDGSYYPYTSTMNYKGFVGALSISVPIIDWGEGYRKVKKAKIEVENAELSYEKNRKLMELQSHQAYSNYSDGIILIESASKAFEEAQQNLDMIQDQYQAGLMTLTDLLEAQSQWQSSYSNLIEAKTQFRINKVDYLRSVGIAE